MLAMFLAILWTLLAQWQAWRWIIISSSLYLGAINDLTLVSCLIGVVNSNLPRLMMVRHYEGLGLNVNYE